MIIFYQPSIGLCAEAYARLANDKVPNGGVNFRECHFRFFNNMATIIHPSLRVPRGRNSCLIWRPVIPCFLKDFITNQVVLTLAEARLRPPVPWDRANDREWIGNHRSIEVISGLKFVCLFTYTLQKIISMYINLLLIIIECYHWLCTMRQWINN